MKKFLFITFFLLTSVTTGSLYLLYLVMDYRNPKDVTFEIEKDESLRSVYNRLEKQNVISSSIAFRFVAKISEDSKDIKYGKHFLRSGLNIFEVYEALKEKTDRQEEAITIPEGYTSKKVANLLVKKGFIKDPQEFIDATRNRELIDKYKIPAGSLEGYLYPDTYFFPIDYGIDNIVSVMVFTFFKKLSQSYPSYSDISPDDLYQKIILASIIQGEYVLDKEAPIIASVFYNRLARGQKLQSCATVVYAITEELGKPHPKRILYKDLEIDSRYNTYLYKGLPPSPISNPGLVALLSALNPDDTDYLYFALKPSLKEHEFSKDYEDHEKARELYIKETF